MKRMLGCAITFFLLILSSLPGAATAQLPAREQGAQQTPGASGPQSRVTARIVGAVYMADQFPGADPAAQINACIVAARATKGGDGGVCDARMFTGPQTMRETIDILNKVVLLIPHSAVWCWGFNDPEKVGLLQEVATAIVGSATGGSGDMYLEPCNANTHMLALYATADNHGDDRNNGYVYATGFQANNPDKVRGAVNRSTFSHGVIYTRNLFDSSRFERITTYNYTGDGWHISRVCCDTTFTNTIASTQTGHGGSALVVEGRSSFSWDGTINGAGPGKPNLNIMAGNYQIDFWNTYMEYGSPADPWDLDHPLVDIADANADVRFHGGGINRPEGKKPCFNDHLRVVENVNFCHGPDGKGVSVTLPAFASLEFLNTFRGPHGMAIDMEGNIAAGTDGFVSARRFYAPHNGGIEVQDAAGKGVGRFGANTNFAYLTTTPLAKRGMRFRSDDGRGEYDVFFWNDGDHNIHATEPVETPQLIATGSVPTMQPGVAAGLASACTAVTGTNMAGAISCKTGTATRTGMLATITFSGRLETPPLGCRLFPTNAAAAPTATMLYTTAPTSTSWTISAVTGLPASTAFTWGYQCM